MSWRKTTTLKIFFKTTTSFFLFIETDISSREQFFTQFEEKFFMFCEKELEKVNTFFAGNLGGKNNE